MPVATRHWSSRGCPTTSPRCYRVAARSGRPSRPTAPGRGTRLTVGRPVRLRAPRPHIALVEDASRPSSSSTSPASRSHRYPSSASCMSWENPRRPPSVHTRRHRRKRHAHRADGVDHLTRRELTRRRRHRVPGGQPALVAQCPQLPALRQGPRPPRRRSAVSARAEPRFTRDVDVAVVTQRATRSLPHWEAPLHHRRGAGGELDRRPQERGQVVRPSRGDEVAVDDYFGVLPLGSRVAQIIGDRRG